MISIAQIKVTALASANGTFVEPVAQAFRPDPYTPLSPQRALSDSVASQAVDALTGVQVFPAPPEMLFYTAIAAAQTNLRVLSLTVKNLDPQRTIWLKLQVEPTAYAYPSVPVALPLLGGGILSLPTPVQFSSLGVYTPSLGMAIDYMIVTTPAS